MGLFALVSKGGGNGSGSNEHAALVMEAKWDFNRLREKSVTGNSLDRWELCLAS